jgi:L-threonylcarbamoyladenylate synthase
VPILHWSAPPSARYGSEPPPPAASRHVVSGARTVGVDANGIRAGVEVLTSGGVVVLPTDTVYGLAARPQDEDAVRAIFELKGRPEGMHLPVLAASVAQVRALGVRFTAGAEALARTWWPGPMTLAFGFDDDVSRPGWLAGRDEVAVRIPNHDFLRAVLGQTGVLLVTSANPHGAPTPLMANDVAHVLGTAVELVVDGGTLSDVPSTLVNVRGQAATLEREGAVSREQVLAALSAAT